jgi:hypothetical protein
MEILHESTQSLIEMSSVKNVYVLYVYCYIVVAYIYIYIYILTVATFPATYIQQLGRSLQKNDYLQFAFHGPTSP